LAWSPDGRSLAVGRIDPDETSLHLVTLDGSAKPRDIGSGWPTAWSRDGAWILCGLQRADTSIDAVAVPADGGEPRPVAATVAEEYGSAFSPDGRWVLIVTDQSGRFELSVVPFGRPGPIRPVTSVGVGSAAHWTDDGRIVYRSGGGELWELDAKPNGDDIEFGEPRALFGGRKVPISRDPVVAFPFSISLDGKRLLVIVPATGEAEPPLILVQNGVAGGER
jgi:Tol biopolymer transport system component